MARSMTRNQSHDDDDASSSSCSRKRFKIFDNGGVSSWSDLNHDVLYLVMLQLGVVDFVAFSGVCSSWRSYAVSNKDWFMASKPPMSISIDSSSNNKDSYCYLEDAEGRRFKSILPHSAGRTCYGITCGYLILSGWETRDFWLVNPITRHQLHFPDYPLYVGARECGIKVILVFSPSISRFMLVVLHKKTCCFVADKPGISFHIQGKRRWNHVSFRDTPHILDIHFFKGKIYTLHTDCSLGELILIPDQNQKCKLTLLETKNIPNPNLFHPQLVSAGENLYMIDRYLTVRKVMELDFGEMKWMSAEKTIGEYVFFISISSAAAIKLASWADPRTPYKRHGYFHNGDGSQQWIYYDEVMWYFPHESLNVSALDD